MSKVKRYALSKETCDFEETKYGCFVWIDDYEKLENDNKLLKSKNKRLKAQVERLMAKQTDIDRIQAQSDFYRSKLMNETEYSANIKLFDQVKHLEAQVKRLTEGKQPPK